MNIRPPELDVKNCISIFISADFLKIQRLLDETSNFICYNISEIVCLPIDMSCISDRLIRILASKIRLEDLDRMIDKKDKLLSKLYMRKLDFLLQSTESKYLLQRCAYCNKLFSMQSQDKLTCSKAKIFIDFHGGVIAKHMPDRAFDFKKFVWYIMSKKQIDYKTLFWRVIAWTLALKCVDCQDWFQGVHYFDCRFHPNQPTFPQTSVNEGYYPCCKKRALRFDTNMRVKGCMQKQHQLDIEESHLTLEDRDVSLSLMID